MGGVFEVFHGRDHYSPLLALPGRGVGAGRAGVVVGKSGNQSFVMARLDDALGFPHHAIMCPSCSRHHALTGNSRV